MPGFPCCCQGPDCTCLADKFVGSSLDTAKWIEQAGDWVEGSGYVETTDSDAALNIDTDAGCNPDGVLTNIREDIKILSTDANGSIHLYPTEIAGDPPGVSTVQSNGLGWAEFDFGDDVIRLRLREFIPFFSSNFTLEIPYTLAPDTWYSVTILRQYAYWGIPFGIGVRLNYTIDQLFINDVRVANWVSTRVSGTNAGAFIPGTGTISGAARFKDFKVQYRAPASSPYDVCPSNPLPVCPWPKTAAATILADLTFTPTSSHGSATPPPDGIYAFDYVADTIVEGATIFGQPWETGCRYVYTFSPPYGCDDAGCDPPGEFDDPGTYDSMEVRFVFNGTILWKLTATSGSGGSSNTSSGVGSTGIGTDELNATIPYSFFFDGAHNNAGTVAARFYLP